MHLHVQMHACMCANDTRRGNAYLAGNATRTRTRECLNTSDSPICKCSIPSVCELKGSPLKDGEPVNRRILLIFTTLQQTMLRLTNRRQHKRVATIITICTNYQIDFFRRVALAESLSNSENGVWRALGDTV